MRQSVHTAVNALCIYKNNPATPAACICNLPKTRIFLPDGNLDLDRVETSLSIEDLEKQQGTR